MLCSFAKQVCTWRYLFLQVITSAVQSSKCLKFWLVRQLFHVLLIMFCWFKGMQAKDDEWRLADEWRSWELKVVFSSRSSQNYVWMDTFFLFAQKTQTRLSFTTWGLFLCHLPTDSPEFSMSSTFLYVKAPLSLYLTHKLSELLT